MCTFYFILTLTSIKPPPVVVFYFDFLCRSSLMGTTLRAVPSKIHTFSTNYHACIAIPTWLRCAPSILFWHWPPFNLFPSSCITSILTDGYHFVFSTQHSICHFDKLSCIYCNAHMIYTYFVLTAINSCFVHMQQHAPPRIAGAGHPCSDRSLFLLYLAWCLKHVSNKKVDTSTCNFKVFITNMFENSPWGFMVAV